MTPAEFAARAEPFEDVATDLLDDGNPDEAEMWLTVADKLHEDADRAESEAAA